MNTIVSLTSLGAAALLFCGSADGGPMPLKQSVQIEDFHVLEPGLSTASIGDPSTHHLLTTVSYDHPLTTAFREGSPIFRVIAIVFGDSMADSYRSIGFCLMDELIQKYGIAGYAMNNYRNHTMPVMSGGALWINMSYSSNILAWGKYWFTDFGLVTPGGSMTWNNQHHPWGLLCNNLGPLMVKNPAGGDIAISISTNGGPFGIVLVTNTYTAGATGEGFPVLIDLPLDYYRMKIDGITGSNIVVGPYIEDTTAPGIVATFIDKGGIALRSVTNVSVNIRNPIFKVLSDAGNRTNVTLLWHMKEFADQSTLDGLIECDLAWSNSLPDALFKYIGTPLISSDVDYLTTDTITVVHNEIIRSFAIQAKKDFVDCLNPCVSYQWFSSMGYLSADGVHLPVEGSRYLLPIVWDSYGFFTGVSNTVASFAQQEGNEVQFGYYTSTNATYTIQYSTNLNSREWYDVPGTAGVGSGWRTNTTGINLSEANRFFRLRLTPP